MATESKNSFRILALLAGLAVAASGWIWGYHHYQISSGAKFSDDERQIFIVRDELEKMEDENALLRAKLQELIQKTDEIDLPVEK